MCGLLGSWHRGHLSAVRASVCVHSLCAAVPRWACMPNVQADHSCRNGCANLTCNIDNDDSYGQQPYYDYTCVCRTLSFSIANCLTLPWDFKFCCQILQTFSLDARSSLHDYLQCNESNSMYQKESRGACQEARSRSLHIKSDCHTSCCFNMIYAASDLVQLASIRPEACSMLDSAPRMQ